MTAEKMVPLELTKEMLQAALAIWPKSARAWYARHDYPNRIYYAMLAAVPSAQPAGETPLTDELHRSLVKASEDSRTWIAGRDYVDMRKHAEKCERALRLAESQREQAVALLREHEKGDDRGMRPPRFLDGWNAKVRTFLASLHKKD